MLNRKLPANFDKVPLYKRTYRISNVAKFLGDRKHPFTWNGKNTICIKLDDDYVNRRWMYITGTITCYKVRIDVWNMFLGFKHNFIYREYLDTTAFTLFSRLVFELYLDKKYLFEKE